MLDKIKEWVKDEELLNVYPYGSKVYGTYHQQSDDDFIVVVQGKEKLKKEIKTDELNITIYDEALFQDLLDEHEISVLECIFLEESHILMKKRTFSLTLDKEKLRKAISAKTSNSWVKAKKKLVIEKDFDPYVAKKSLFHTFRILLFGIQLATAGSITNYKEANDFYEEIIKNPSNKWEDYKKKYQPIYNQLKSTFKKVCPK